MKLMVNSNWLNMICGKDGVTENISIVEIEYTNLNLKEMKRIATLYDDIKKVIIEHYKKIKNDKEIKGALSLSENKAEKGALS